MIIKGTTPYHTFILPMKVEDIGTVWVTYAQNGEVILNKSNTDGDFIVRNMSDLYENASVGEDIEDEEPTEEELNSSQLTLHLTQEDTLKFHFFKSWDKNTVFIQIRILDKAGEAYVSTPLCERLMNVLNPEVMTYETT